MDTVLGLLRSDLTIFIMLIAIVLLLVLYIISVANLSKLRKSYSKFMSKLGNGNNIEEIMKEYIKKVDTVQAKNEEIISFCKVLDENLKKCTQKIGIVRYNAFKDTGSDLSFTLALLNDYNDGVVLNGIYSREMSNIYAKPIKNGTSTYTISPEEKEAINRAIQSDIIEIRE